MGAAMTGPLTSSNDVDLAAVENALRCHVHVLTVEIGERSVDKLSGHARATLRKPCSRQGFACEKSLILTK